MCCGLNIPRGFNPVKQCFRESKKKSTHNVKTLHCIQITFFQRLRDELHGLVTLCAWTLTPKTTCNAFLHLQFILHVHELLSLHSRDRALCRAKSKSLVERGTANIWNPTPEDKPHQNNDSNVGDNSYNEKATPWFTHTTSHSARTKKQKERKREKSNGVFTRLDMHVFIAIAAV